MGYAITSDTANRAASFTNAKHREMPGDGSVRPRDGSLGAEPETENPTFQVDPDPVPVPLGVGTAGAGGSGVATGGVGGFAFTLVFR
jgi:hypothetical protein